MRHATLVAIAGLVLTATHAAKASVIFSDTSGGYSNSTHYYGPVAFEFTASQTATVQTIDLFLDSLGGSASYLSETVTLSTDLNDTPATVLGAWTGTSSGSVFYNQPFEETLSGLSGVTLTQGTTYFLQVGNAYQLPNLTWLPNAAGVQTSGYYSGGAWHAGALAAPDFDILGTVVTPVAEPGTLALLGTGLLCMGGLLRRSRTNAAAA
jgi:hypothetical protein